MTHHYAGRWFGNEALYPSPFSVSNPRLAARQGLLE
ncbi:hypothetical protein ACNKHU_08890 [Shigella flexneri]